MCSISVRVDYVHGPSPGIGAVQARCRSGREEQARWSRRQGPTVAAWHVMRGEGEGWRLAGPPELQARDSGGRRLRNMSACPQGVAGVLANVHHDFTRRMSCGYVDGTV